jgi:transposase
MPMTKIARLVDEHDTRLWRIINHHVAVAKAKKDYSSARLVGCDETSRKKGHNYITVFADMKSKEVLFATKGKDSTTIKRFAELLEVHNAQASQIKEITIDMSPAFIRGTADYLTNAQITFDKFHVIQALNKVQDEVRKIEQRENPLLKKSKYLWLRNPDNLSEKQESQLAELQSTKLKTAKVYQMKLVFQDIYREIKDPNAAEAAIKKWLSWAVRSRIEPVKEFAKMIKKHWDGIMRYFTSRLTSGAMESINSRIQNLKRRARGYGNVDNFISMIYLEMANLEFDFPT